MDGSWEGETARVAALTDDELEAEAAIDREEEAASGAAFDSTDGSHNASASTQLRRRGGMRLGRFLSVLSPVRLAAAAGSSSGSGGTGAASAGGSASASRVGGSRGPEPLTEDLLAAQAQLFFLAGSDTTACALSYLLYCLALHPAAADQVAAELDAWRPGGGIASSATASTTVPTATELRDSFPKLNAAINEALRLYPPLPSVVRAVDCPLNLGGRAVPPGAPLRVAVYALHRSARVWGPDAATFRLDRWVPGGQGEAVERAGGFAPFGGGARRCPGFKFVLQLVRLTAWHLLCRFRLELLPGQEPLHCSTGITMAPTHGISVRLHPRR